MKLFYATFIAIALSGCSTKRIVVKNFETSNSLCIDALVVNLISAGCKTIYSSQGENYAYLRCDDRDTSSGAGILNYEFYLMPTPIYQEQEDTDLICADSNITITTSERD